MERLEYKIEVSCVPDTRYNPGKPYFWCVVATDAGGVSSNAGFGWADSIKSAFDEAYESYRDIKERYAI